MEPLGFLGGAVPRAGLSCPHSKRFSYGSHISGILNQTSRVISVAELDGALRIADES
jgi:hypothetical protein